MKSASSPWTRGVNGIIPITVAKHGISATVENQQSGAMNNPVQPETTQIIQPDNWWDTVMSWEILKMFTN